MEASAVVTQPLLEKNPDDSFPDEEQLRTKSKNRFISYMKAIPGLLWDNGLLCIIMAALLFSTMSMFVKLLGRHVPTFQVVLIRSVFSFTLTLWLLWMHGVEPLFGSMKRYPLLFMRGFLGAAGMTLSYFGIAYLPLAEAVTIFFSNPALTALLEWLLTGEPLGWSGSLSTVACLMGVLLVANPPFLHGPSATGWSKEHILGVVFSFGGAWSIAASFIVVRFLGKSEPAFVLAMWYHLVATFTSGIPLAFSFPSPPVLPTSYECTLLAGVAVTSFLGQLLLNRGFQLESATKASAVNVAQVLFSYVWDLAVFHHSLTLQAVCGSLLITFGVVVISKRRRENKATSKFVQQTLISTAQDLNPNLLVPPAIQDLNPNLSVPPAIPEDEPFLMPPNMRRALSRTSLSMSYSSLPTFSLPLNAGSVPIAVVSPRERLQNAERYGSLPANSMGVQYGSVADSILSWFEDPIDDYDRYADQIEEDNPVQIYRGLVDKTVAEVMEPEAQLFNMS